MTAYRDWIEATLTPNPDDLSTHFKADILFRYRPGCGPTRDDPGWEPEVEILHVTPVGIVAPITDEALRKLAENWLKNGGYEACCRLAERNWE